MSDKNPYEPGSAESAEPAESNSEGVSSAVEAYNVVSDTVVGLNFRKSDNKFQAKFIFVSVVLLALVGAVLALLNSKWELPWYGGAIAGAFAGLVIGFFASGIYLMIYRATRHMKGKHD